MAPPDMSLFDTVSTSIAEISTGPVHKGLPEDFVVPLRNSPCFIAFRFRHVVMCDLINMLNTDTTACFSVYHGPMQPELNELQLWQKNGDIQAIFPMANMIQMPTRAESSPFYTVVTFAQILVRRNSYTPPLLPLAPVPLPAPSAQNIARIPRRRISSAHVRHRFFQPHPQHHNVATIPAAAPQTTWVMPPRKNVPPFKKPPRPTVVEILQRYVDLSDLDSDDEVGSKRKRGYEEDDSEPSSKRPALYLAALGAGLVLNHFLR